MPDPDEQLSASYIRAVLDAFGKAAQTQDVKAMLSVVTDDGIIVGSSSQEKAFGRTELTSFLERLFSELGPIHWEWDSWEVRSTGSCGWFFVEGRVRAGDQIAPYRASGVCLRDEMGEWKLAMFHGSTPDG